MDIFSSSKTAQGVNYVWLQHNREKALAGRLLLEEAYRDGDRDAGAFLAQTAQGSIWIWSFSTAVLNDQSADGFLRGAIERGSHYAIAAALLWGEWTPALQRGALADRPASAWETVSSAADAGDPMHQFLLAEAYLRREEAISGLPQQSHPVDCAMRWLEKALTGGLDLAGGRLFYLYHHTPGREKDAQRILDTCAGMGSPMWEENMAVWLFANDRAAEGFRWACRAAEHGQLTAWAVLGQAYLSGQGVTADPEQARVCFELGAKNGHAAAQRELAWLYFTGKHTPRDEARAAYWAGRACDAPEGEREHIFPLLAHCMLHGVGVPKDPRAALQLMDQALRFNSAQGNVLRYDARCCGLLYRDAGEVCEKGMGRKRGSISKAAKAYELASEFGDEQAAIWLASLKKGLFGRWKRK